MEDDAKILMALARVLAYVGVLETTVIYVVVCLDEILQLNLPITFSFRKFTNSLHLFFKCHRTLLSRNV